MRRAASSTVLRSAGMLIGAAIVLVAQLAAATEPWTNLRPRAEDIVGTLSCMSASCHGGNEPRGAMVGFTGHAYVPWLSGEVSFRDGRRAYDPRAQMEKDYSDPHALAGQRIGESRFQEVLRRASQRADGLVDAQTYERCAQCHDPLGVTHHNPPATREIGIGCESCHGGARQWIAVHYQRDVVREQLTQLGMIDTKNLFVRARQCAACHVGSADQDMNHDMIAAGHPPLRFELASYEALLPQKHWDDRPRRLVEPDYEVQLWAAGRIAAADAALALLEARARRAGDRRHGTGNREQGTWPEFAEGNCFACHQPLRSESTKPSLTFLTADRAGVPPWQTWNMAMAGAAIPPRTIGVSELPAPGGSFADAVNQLRAAMERSMEPDAADVVRLAGAAKAALHHQVLVSPTGMIVDQDDSALGAATVLRNLAASKEAASWDQMCQDLAALVALERSLHDRRAIGNEQHKAMQLRVGELARALRFGLSDREWPVVFTRESALSLADIERTLTAVRRELAAAAEAAR